MRDETIGLILTIVTVVIVLTFGFVGGYFIGYRQGQIDALTGNVYYELQEQPDHTVIWVECPDVCQAGGEFDHNGK